MDPTGNTFTAINPISVQQPAADLTSESINSPDQPIVIAGTNVSPQPASVLVENRGSIAAKGDISVSFYLSTDQTLDSRDVLAASVSDIAINLKAGKGKVVWGGVDSTRGHALPGNITRFRRCHARNFRGIVQRSIADETGVAAGQVQVVRPAQPVVPTQSTPAPIQPPVPQPVSGVDAGTGTTTTTTPAPDTGTVDCPPTNNCPTPAECPPATDCPPQAGMMKILIPATTNNPIKARMTRPATTASRTTPDRIIQARMIQTSRPTTPATRATPARIIPAIKTTTVVRMGLANRPTIPAIINTLPG